MKRSLRITAVAVTLAAGGAVVALQTINSSAADKPLNLPAVSQFAAGACRDTAPAVLTLASVTSKNDGTKTLSKAARNELVIQGNKLVAARPTADAAIAQKMTNLLASIGYVRIRTGTSYNAQLLRDVETARSALQTACTG
jgi:hypothetical protein